MIIKFKKELYFEMLQECVEAQELLLDAAELIKDLSVRDLVNRHWETLRQYHDYLYTLSGTYVNGESVYCVDYIEFSTAISLVGIICPVATAFAHKCFSEPVSNRGSGM